MNTITTIMLMVLIAAAIGIATSTIMVNSAFAGAAGGPSFNNPGQCHQFANGIGVPHGKDISKSVAQFCKGQHNTPP